MNFKMWGGLLGGLGVMLGAFGAHSLPQIVPPDRLSNASELFRTASHYQLVHAVMMVLVGMMLDRADSKPLRWAGRLFGIGIVIFCGSLYAMGLGAPTWFGAITPLGGLSFIAGWITLAVASLKSA